MPTEVISTIATSGGDYTTLTAWESGEQADLVSADEIAVAEIDGTFVGVYPTVAVDGWTTDSTRRVIWRAKSGSEYDPTDDSGSMLIDNASANIGVDFQSGHYGLIKHLGIDFTQAAHTSMFYRSGGDGDQLKLENVYAVGYYVNSTGLGADNCFFRQTAGSGALSGSGITYRNVTFINESGAGAFGGDIMFWQGTAYNCVAYNPNTKSSFNTFHSMAGGDYNQQNDNGSSNPPGANSNNTLTTSDFEDFANDDYRPASGSVLVDSGDDLSAYFTDDLIGNARDANFDIGAFELVSGGGVTLTAVPRKRHNFTHMLVR